MAKHKAKKLELKKYMRRQMKLMMHEMEEKEWELADEILKESRRRQNPGDLSRDELSEQFGYVTNI